MEKELPHEFMAMLCDAVGTEAAGALSRSLAHDAPTLSVRINSAKGATAPCGAETVAWEECGFYIGERPLFAADPAWHQGVYYVQDASSMAVGTLAAHLASRFFAPDATLCYLDACAAPGGKTIGAIDALGQRAFVLANEADRRRASVLAENIAKHGSPDVAVACGPAQRLGSLTETFDIIAADAPCSGEGMMRKEPEAVAQWTPGLVDSCAALQKDIVESLWPALKPGGIFIYSTCTFNRREDEEVVRHIIDITGAELIDIDAQLFPGATKGECGLRFLPGTVKGEGLFMAALRKPVGETRTRRPAILPKATPGMAEFARMALSNPADFTISANSAIRTVHSDAAARISTVKGLMRIGLPLGELKGKAIVPSHELALSTVLKPDAFAALELSYPAAMAYLRGEAMPDIPDGTPKGFITPLWQGLPLGFAKNIGRRANNLYPDAIRLRLQPSQLPPSPPKIL